MSHLNDSISLRDTKQEGKAAEKGRENREETRDSSKMYLGKASSLLYFFSPIFYPSSTRQFIPPVLGVSNIWIRIKWKKKNLINKELSIKDLYNVQKWQFDREVIQFLALLPLSSLSNNNL